MEINFTTLSIAVIINFILSAIWYTPLFGKKHGEIIGTFDAAGKMTPLGELMCKPKNMAQLMVKLMGTQLVLTAVTNFILYKLVLATGGASPYSLAFSIWLGFIFPLVAGDVLWSALPSTLRYWKLFIATGIHLICLTVSAFIFASAM